MDRGRGKTICEFEDSLVNKFKDTLEKKNYLERPKTLNKSEKNKTERKVKPVPN